MTRTISSCPVVTLPGVVVSHAAPADARPADDSQVVCVNRTILHGNLDQMARTALFLSAFLVPLSGCGGDRRETVQPPRQVDRVEAEVGEDQHQDDKSRWQEYLDNKDFDFREEEVDIFYSLSKFDGDCEIHMVMNQPRRDSIEFRFVRDGKTLLSVPGTQYVPFRHADNVVYFAHHDWIGAGGLLGAYDLNTGKRLWLKKLKAVQSIWGKANQINLRLHNGVLHVIGHVSGDEYEEIFDPKSGKRLAYRVFRGRPVSEELFQMNVPEELR